ncbi:extracellular solute-binding protein, partial [Neglectibacter timonensis]
MLLTGCAAPASTVPESSEEQSRVSLRNDGAEAKLVLVELETSQARTDALREIADKYEADFPKTEIEIITLKNAQELEARLSAGGQTDLLELHSGWVPAYVEKGMLTDIKPYMEVWDEWYSLSAAAKQGARCMGEEHVYLLPASTSQDALYYRKDWFESYNDAHPESTLLVPRVWEEVEKAAAALSDQGAGLAVAGKDRLVDYMDSVVWSSVNVGRMVDISAAYFSRGFEGKSIFSLEQAQ